MADENKRSCTWQDCTRDGTREQIAQDGAVWAVLCEQHHKELDDAIGSMNPPVLMRAWVRAQGGAKKAAAR
jgi:hypothetical protein